MKRHIKTDSMSNPVWGITAITAFAALLLASLTGPAAATGISSARSVAMGTAATALAEGVDAARYNPANLGIASFRQNGVELLGFGANISNNSFTLSDYNEYTGAFLTADDKEYILSQVPSEGLSLNIEAEANAMGIALGSFSIGVTGIALADINLNKDLLELVLNGNTFADTINITGSYSEAVGLAAAYASYGKSIYRSGNRELAVGATVKYLQGLGIERVVELEGMAATFTTGFEGEGRMIAQTATGGSGYAVDLGTALKLSNKYTVGACVKNLVSSLKWTKDTEEHGYIFSFDTMTVDNMEEDYIESDDYSIDIPSFSTTLPAVLNVGVAKTAGSLLWALDWEQGFRRATGASSKPRISAGAEWLPIGFFPIRAGFSTGGNKNTAFSFGSGFHFPVFFIDYAFVTGSSLSGYSSKGLNFAITTGLHF